MPRSRQRKALGQPRGRMTPYSCFIQKCREAHRQAHPHESVVFGELVTVCSDAWKTMTDEEKKRFYDMARVDKIRYDNEMIEFNKRVDEQKQEEDVKLEETD